MSVRAWKGREYTKLKTEVEKQKKPKDWNAKTKVRHTICLQLRDRHINLKQNYNLLGNYINMGLDILFSCN